VFVPLAFLFSSFNILSARDAIAIFKNLTTAYSNRAAEKYKEDGSHLDPIITVADVNNVFDNMCKTRPLMKPSSAVDGDLSSLFNTASGTRDPRKEG